MTSTDTVAPLYRRGHVKWHGRHATIWHAIPPGQGPANALCGRTCNAYPQAIFDRLDPHSCAECVHLLSESVSF